MDPPPPHPQAVCGASTLEGIGCSTLLIGLKGVVFIHTGDLELQSLHRPPPPPSPPPPICQQQAFKAKKPPFMIC